MDTDSDDDCYGAIGSMWGVKPTLPHVEQSPHTNTQLDFQNSVSTSQNSSLETVFLTMSSEEDSSSSGDGYKIKRRSRREKVQKKILKKLHKIEQTQHEMSEFLQRVQDTLSKLEVPFGSYPSRRVKLDLQMIRLLEDLNQGAVTEQERVKIDQLVLDMKDELSHVLKDLDQELKEAGTKLSGGRSAKEIPNDKDRKGERSKIPPRNEAELSDTVELKIKKGDKITTIESSSSSDEESVILSSDGENDGDNGDTRKVRKTENSPEREEPQEGVSKSSGKAKLDRKERYMALNYIECQEHRWGNRYYCKVCGVSIYKKEHLQKHIKSLHHKRKLPDLKSQLENGQKEQAQLGKPSSSVRPDQARPTEENNSNCQVQGCKRVRAKEFIMFCGEECFTAAVDHKKLKQ